MRVDGPDVTQSMSNLVNEIRKFGDRTGRSFELVLFILTIVPIN